MSSGIDFDRNQILQEFAESSFEQALEEVSLRLTTEKKQSKASRPPRREELAIAA